MWFGKSIMTKLGLALALAVPAFAAPVAPFTFADVGSAEDQQKYWDDLMKYKVFGTDSVYLHNEKIRITDSSGWIGTNGDFIMSTNGQDTLGGPIVVGGDFVFRGRSEQIINGPTHIYGSILFGKLPNYGGSDEAGFNSYKANELNGDVCVQNSVYDGSPNYTGISQFMEAGKRYFAGEKGYAACPIKDEYFINSKLAIPTYVKPADSTERTAIHMDGASLDQMAVRYIDVPKGNFKEPYDIYIEGITMANFSKLVIRQQAGGRLTRIFMRNGMNVSSESRVVVAYENVDDEGNGLGTYHELANKEYAGTLLFYTNQKIYFPAMEKDNGATFQGSFITTGELEIAHHLVLAGQILANGVRIDTDFDGSSFIYVPFDPPVLKIDPKLLSEGRWPESNNDSLVPVQLDTFPKTDVTFKYCFDVQDSSVAPEGYASIQDFHTNKEADYDTSNAVFPICGKNESQSVRIKANSKEPAKEFRIYINVAIDDLADEKDEKLILKVFGVTGAVMPGNKHEGTFTLYITDETTPKFDNNDKDPYKQNENPVNGIPADKIVKVGDTIRVIDLKNVTYEKRDSIRVEMKDINLASGKIPATKLFEIVIDSNTTTKKVYAIIKVKNVKTDSLSYEANVAPNYDIGLSLIQIKGTTEKVVDTLVRHINVIDLNEKPVLKDTTFSTPENQLKNTTVGVIAAKDPDTKNVDKYGYLQYSFIDGSSLPFTITTSDNKGTIKTSVDSLDYETIPDHKYEFDVQVANCERDDSGNLTTKCLYDTAHVVVEITDVNEPPVIVDDGKTFEIDEYTQTNPIPANALVGKLEVKDVDGVDVAPKLVVTYTVTDDATSGPKFDDLFTVTNHAVLDDAGKMWLVVSVKDDPTAVDYESIKSSYSITMKVTDAGSNVVQVKKTIVIKDVNEAPSITGVRGENDGLPAGETRAAFTLYPVENLPEDASIGVVQALDPDTKHPVDFGHLEFRIIPDVTDLPFYMKGGMDSTIYVADASKMNHEDDTVYTFRVEVNNCEKNASTGKYTEHCLADTAVITVKIQNVPEPPGIQCYTGDTNCLGPYDVLENTALKTLVHAFQIVDPDKNQAKNMDTVWLADRTSGGKAATYFEAVTNGDSLKIVVKSGINYETLGKDTIFNVRVTIQDYDGKTAYIDRTINIVDVNERPTIAGKDTTITIPENLEKGKEAGRVPATDPDVIHPSMYAVLTYKIIDEKVPFEMKNGTEVIVVTNPDTLNYEALKPDTTFTFRVQVENCPVIGGSKTKPCLYDTAKVSLSVKDEPEPTIIVPPCKGPKCSECVGETCVEEIEELCTENCDTPRDTTSTSILTLSVKENSKTGFVIADYLVRDDDVGVNHDTLIAKFTNSNNSGADTLFNVQMKKLTTGDWRLIVSVKNGSKLDYEKIKASHDLTISVNDPADPSGMGDVIYRIIKVVDVNEAPTITGVTDFNKDVKDADKAAFTFYPKENMKNDEAIGIVIATDPDTIHKDEFARLEYSVVDPNGDIPFAMKDSLLVVKDSSKMDYESSKTEYKFDVQVDNCEWEKSGSEYVKTDRCLDPVIKTVTVKIQNVNEPPIIVIDGPDDPDGEDDSNENCIAFCDTTSRGVTPTDTLTVGVKENPENPNGTRKIVTPTGTVLFQYHVVDEDTGHVAGAKVTWFDVGSTIPSVSTKGSDLFKIDYKNSVITVTVNDEKLLDYEALRNASSRNDPDPEYTMGIVVTDPKGMADTLYRTIRVTDENEKPLFDVWPLVITENNKINDSLGHVEHPSDIDSLSRDPALYDNGFKMTGGDTALFWLDKDSTDLMRVMIRANVVLDCENGEYTCGQDSMYWVYMTYGDTTLRTTYTDLKIPVKLIDLDEAPEILTDSIGVDENSPKGTVVDTIKWTDVDHFDSVVTFKIVKDPIGCFDIDSKTGVVTISDNKCPGLDFEKNPTIDLTVGITDMVNVPDSLYDENCKCQLISAKDGPITTTKTITVNIHDVNEPPSISDKTIAVPESTTVWTVIDTVKATDPDKDPKKRDLTYTIVDGDSTVFMIDPKKGIVILKDTLDYETKKEYVIYVQVDDGEFADTAKIKINVTNVIEQSVVVITKYENRDSTWNYPDTVYTNKKNGVITWRQDNEIVSADTTLKKGKNVIVITYKDPSKDLPGKDTVVIMFNDDSPIVEVTANPTHVKADNVFTIVENTGDADTNIYVNKERDSVYVHVKDPASKRDTSFALEVNLEPVKVSDAMLEKMNTIADSKIMLDETPSGGVTHTAVNGEAEKISYEQLIGGDTVTVSYMVDMDGEPIKVSVINSKGKKESIEVITVTYKTMVGDQEVEISYQADALTGQILAKGPNGELMVQGASSKNSYKSGKNSEKNSNVSEGIFSVTTVKIDQLGSPMVVSYAIDEKGNMVKNAEGDIGYSVTYSYKNIYGNIATESVFIVLDQTFPVVEILSPINYAIIRSNFVEVKWTVNGVEQDSLTIQGLEKGPNIIVRFYRDKAGNEASDTVSVMMKDTKSVDIAVEQPVTEIDKDKVEEYYSVNPPKKGETFAVSIKNPSTGKEVETLIGGSFKTKEGSGEEPYPGIGDGDKHLGPTLAMDIKLPVIVPKEGFGSVSGLATLDDIVVSDGMIALEGVDADNATKISVEEYVEKFCEDGIKVPSDISQFNLYDSKLHAKIWVYTSLGNFVDYFSFKQDLNDPEFTDEAGMLKMYFEMKPDKNGFVKADNGKQYATGAYVYKVEATIRSKLRCTLPSADFDPKEYRKTGDGFGKSAKRKGDVIKNSDELLKSFGYRRPKD